MLIYRLLGEDVENSFARSWGISYGMGAATEVRLASPSLLPRMHAWLCD